MNIINIVEGFDFVGKGAFIKEILRSRNVYHPDYNIFDKHFDRNLAFMYGYGQVDLINALQLKDIEITYDRGLFSSWVYSRLYGNERDWLPDDILHDYINKLRNEDTVATVYHICHKDKSSARRIYESDKNHNDKLDQFDSFEAYWMYYKCAEELFDTCYKVHGVEVVKYATISSESGEKVDLVRL